MMEYNETSNCKYRETCHFYNLQSMTHNSRHQKKLYCIDWPEQCEIYQTKLGGRPVPITLWPKGKILLK